MELLILKFWFRCAWSDFGCQRERNKKSILAKSKVVPSRCQ